MPIGRVVELGDLEMHRPAVISGRIVDPQGNPVRTRLSFNPHVRGSPYQALFEGDAAVTTSAADGTFTVGHIAPGRFVVRIVQDYDDRSDRGSPTWSVLPFLVDSTTGPVDNLRIVVHPTTPVLFRAPEGSEKTVSFYVLGADGLPHVFRALFPGEPQTLRLAPGSHRLLLGRGEEISETIPLEVGAQPLETTVGE